MALVGVSAVGFDLDGTLFDHLGSARDGVESFFRSLGVEPTEAAVTSWFTAEQREFERWRGGRISFQEQRRARLRAVLPPLGVELPTGDDDLDALFEEYLRAYRGAWRAFPGSRSLLRQLRSTGYRVGLLTNGIESQQRDKLDLIGLSDEFDAICVSESIGVQKPDPRAFAALATALDVTPSSCLFVGDDPGTDVAGARAAGMRSLLIDRSGQDRAGIERKVLDALSEGAERR
ncbi:putative hydrolase of the HAD superfamily [Curtobacterium sp. PhB130]|uniref:HAD family hydrolase n=1 Tax=Curtobacterium sp. PhB130 TaxID=2485178 RepID=UPI000F4CA97D|nr:HAD family hydrolase [Curtobacterium sp. PhB130]ROS73919.1 putative hydrolase of the HAD superfamily [Curtobacterium sp. PhB130]